MVEWRILLTAPFHIFSSSSQLCSHTEWKYLLSVLSPTEGMALHFGRPVLPRKVSICHSNTAPFHSGMPAFFRPCWHLASECVPSNILRVLSPAWYTGLTKSVSEFQRLTCVVHSDKVWKEQVAEWVHFLTFLTQFLIWKRCTHAHNYRLLSAPHLLVLVLI